MSVSADMQLYRESGLMPHQAQLVRDVLDSSVPVRRVLVATPGSGKTVAAVSLANEIAKANSNYRILIIGPRIIGGMYEQLLTRAIPNARVCVVTRRVLRELEATAEEGQPIWPVPYMAVLGMDTARQEDVIRHLRSVSWDFVVVEELQLFARSRWTLLKTIITDKAFERVLLIGITSNLKGVESLLKNTTRTEWLTSDLKDWAGRPLFAGRLPAFNTVRYRRSGDEVSLLRSVLALTEELASTTVGQTVKKTLLKQAASSPPALERTVRHLRNALAHGLSDTLLTWTAGSPIEQGSEGLESDADMAAFSTPARTPWRSKARAFEALAALLERLESMHADKKREALESLLQRLDQDAGPHLQHICILCSSRATANYLHTVVMEHGKNTWLLTGENTPEQFNKTLDGFKNDGGVLISTLFVLQGLDFRYVEAFIHYDLPVSEAEMWARVNRSPAAANYVLIDESGVLPTEWDADKPPASAST